MSEKRTKGGEAGWIAEEIFDDAVLTLRSRCLAIDDQIERGVLDLEDALEIYEVSENEYMEFYIHEQNARAEARFHGKSPIFQTRIKIKYLNSFFHTSTSNFESDLILNIGDNMNKLESDFENGRVKVIS